MTFPRDTSTGSSMSMNSRLLYLYFLFLFTSPELVNKLHAPNVLGILGFHPASSKLWRQLAFTMEKRLSFLFMNFEFLILIV